ncbi:MAG: hypothetical protein WBS20_00645 [Lysobacterales bacterium]
MKLSPLTVLVLHEAIGPVARADELDTLIQAEQVSVALRKLGLRVSTMRAGLDLGATLASVKALQPDLVFNLVESLGGDGRMIHFLPTLLRSADVPFTGSDGDAIYLSSQKQLAKKWMRLTAIPTPVCIDEDAEGDDSDGRWIVKSVWEHASFGMDDGCVIDGTRAAKTRIADSIARHGGEWFAEQFIDGREFNISVLERAGHAYVLPIAEIGFSGFPPGKPKIVGYAAKWQENAPEYLATPRIFPDLPEGLHDALTRVAQRCWKSFGMHGYARVDIRVDSDGNPWVLEVNANPCLTRDAGFAAAAERAGIGYEQLIELVVTAGLETGPSVETLTAGRPKRISSVGKG